MTKNIVRLLSIAATLCLMHSVIGESAEAARMDKREHRQGARIRQGVKSGELTKGEAQRAGKKQLGIKRAEERAESDGVVTRREKAGIERRQDKASHQIHRLKHNDRKRGDGADEGSDAPGAGRSDAPDVDSLDGEDATAPDLPPASDNL